MKRIISLFLTVFLTATLISCEGSKEEYTFHLNALGISADNNEVKVWTNSLGVKDYTINENATITIRLNPNEKEVVHENLINYTEYAIDRVLERPLVNATYKDFEYNEDFTRTVAYIYEDNFNETLAGVTGYAFSGVVVPFQVLNGVQLEDVQFTHSYIVVETGEVLFTDTYTYDMLLNFNYDVFDY